MIPLRKNHKGMLGYGLLQSCPGISHFVTTRHGGVSKGSYASFNCSPWCGDDPAHVRENLSILQQGISWKPESWVIPRQTHGTEVFEVDQEYLSLSDSGRSEILYGIDALITNLPGHILCISTADCVPVLLYDRKHQAIGAVHAGWRGTVGRILEKTLHRMRDCFDTEGSDLLACIGPSISGESFEVGEDVVETFRQEGFDRSRIASLNTSTGKYHIDLWEANRMQLNAFDIPDTQIEMAGICTYRQCDDFFSARRLGIHSGRILSGIALKP
ncbi:MAG: peptidoglycan editing factor PgeF [Bacteroides sp.]|nr:peptidoglycan editing factor PgeF [Bacteroides sp.]